MPESKHLRALAVLWFLASVGVLAYGFYLAIFVAPVEATMGNVYRIFYWHVPTNICAFIFPYVNLAGALWLLAVRNRRPGQALKADALALAGAEITVLYSTLGLVTGMLWARPVWGIWWTWDARLTTALLLWVLYVAYLVLRRFSATGQAGSQTATLAAILSVFAAIDVPISYMSMSGGAPSTPPPSSAATASSTPPCGPPCSGTSPAGACGASSSSASATPSSAAANSPPKPKPSAPSTPPTTSRAHP